MVFLPGHALIIAVLATVRKLESILVMLTDFLKKLLMYFASRIERQRRDSVNMAVYGILQKCEFGLLGRSQCMVVFAIDQFTAALVFILSPLIRLAGRSVWGL